MLLKQHIRGLGAYQIVYIFIYTFTVDLFLSTFPSTRKKKDRHLYFIPSMGGGGGDGGWGWARINVFSLSDGRLFK